MTQIHPEQILHQAFEEVLNIADPQRSLPTVLSRIFPNGIKGNLLVVGGGKASASMAKAFEQYAAHFWPNAKIYGHVVTRYQHDIPAPHQSRKIKVTQASHPFPDEAGFLASKDIMELVDGLNPGDLCVGLISGGGSSLLALPAKGVSLESLTNLSKELLKCGAPIEEINTVRKHVSAIQGGRLAQRAVERGATLQAFIISDVTGDQPSDIASGPCSHDTSTFQDALGVLEKYQLHLQPSLFEITQHLQAGILGKIPETLKLGDWHCRNIHNEVFATAKKGLDAAAAFCVEQGYEVHQLGDQIMGESREVARSQSDMMRSYLQHSDAKKIAWISGGETTVTIPQGVHGRGGRCTEFLLALMSASKDIQGMSALAADTDGIDGTENNAGAFFTPSIWRKLERLSLDMDQYLVAHDAYGFFSQLDQLVMTGPTLTNVNDFRIVLINRNE